MPSFAAVVSWTILFVAIKALETPDLLKQQENLHIDDVPLSKALGFTLDKDQTFKDAGIEREYLHMYKELLNAAKATNEKYLPNDFGPDAQHDGSHRKRGAPILSLAGQRRARSQELRREKLNSQSLRSHMEHSRRQKIKEPMD